MAKMISDEDAEKLIDRLLERVEKANELFLKNIGASLKQIKELKPSKAHKLIQMLRYGTKYDDIIEQLQKYTDLNVKEIDEMFKVYSEKDADFSEQFYKYKNIQYMPYKKNSLLRQQTENLASIVKKEMYNFSRSNVLGYTIDGKFFNLRDTYNKLLDEAFILVGQGKENFDTAMFGILKDIGGSGLRTLEYESGRKVRLDSAVRMHLQSRLRELHNENQALIGKDIGADGVEISVHINPAPDHTEVQGRQFSTKKSKQGLSEYEKLQTIGIAKDYTGREIDLHLELKSGETAEGFRPISEYNCYHYVFSIVLGVSKPLFSNEALQKIKEDNEKGFELDGKHYTNYEGTQLQRALERKIREQKDIQILARASDNKDLIHESQENITALTDKYNELCKVSGLPKKADRLRVSGYKRVKLSSPKQFGDEKVVPSSKPISEATPVLPRKLKENEIFVSKEENERLNEYFLEHFEEHKDDGFYTRNEYQKARYQKLLDNKKAGYKDEIIKLDSIESCNKLLDKINTEIVGDEIKKTDFRLLKEVSKEVYDITKNSPSLLRDLKLNRARIDAVPKANFVASTRWNNITLNNSDYSNYKTFKEMSVRNTELHLYLSGEKHSWWSEVAKGNETRQTITHEMGHRLQKAIASDISFHGDDVAKARDYFFDKYGGTEDKFGKHLKISYREIRRDLIYEPIRRLQAKSGSTQKQIINKYTSMYGRSDYDEMFAETFANGTLGKSNPLGDELINFLKELDLWK